MRSWVGNSAHDTRAKCLACLEGREAHRDRQTISECEARDLQTDCGEVLETTQSKVALSMNQHLTPVFGRNLTLCIHFSIPWKIT